METMGAAPFAEGIVIVFMSRFICFFLNLTH